MWVGIVDESTAIARPSRRGVQTTLAWLSLLALAWRAVLIALTPVPSEDGVSYLWMAERFAVGDFAAPLGEVFPPLLSLLAAPLIAAGLDAWLAVQSVLALAGAASVWACARLAAALAPDPTRAREFALAAAWLTAFATLPARYCAEVYTEPLFILVVALAAHDAVRQRWLTCGAWAGVAFWLRSEALVLPIALALTRRGAWRALLPAGGAVVGLALVRGVAGHGFDLVPKLGFNWSKSALGDSVAALADGLSALPGAWFEAFGVAGGLALAGFALRRGSAARGLRLALLCAVVVVVAFATRRRFLVAWWPLVVPYAVLGLSVLPGRMRLLALASAVVLGGVLGLRTTSADRVAEREVALALRARLGPGEVIVSDLTRVVYFAGQRPLPPRHFTPDELLALARAANVRFVVLGARREGFEAVRAGLLGLDPRAFEPETLPPSLAALAATRGLEVFRRR